MQKCGMINEMKIIRYKPSEIKVEANIALYIITPALNDTFAASFLHVTHPENFFSVSHTMTCMRLHIPWITHVSKLPFFIPKIYVKKKVQSYIEG